jgi:hypothetical protein
MMKINMETVTRSSCPEADAAMRKTDTKTVTWCYDPVSGTTTMATNGETNHIDTEQLACNRHNSEENRYRNSNMVQLA